MLDDPFYNSFLADEWLNSFFGDPFFSRHDNFFRHHRPLFEHSFHFPRIKTFAHQCPLDLEDKGDSLVATIDVPNFDPKDISVEVKNNGRWLIVSGEQKPEKEEVKEEAHYYYRERSTGQFSRQIMLPEPVDKEKTKASFENGTLTISMPKSRKSEEGSDKIGIEVR